ncbi:M24 family metallopeptidase [Haladaptatus pallidirubidus]|uniref:Xaa-Pro peptidase family protein n=1 Tax=Haladaptatus pallidirubidus TaxID=1008152 RepID=A0AAV3UC09_9EURY|nr:Xaa-Pro peptidase family protein [Haladaptatus pallidirubidus]
MAKNLSALDSALDSMGVDGFLIDAASSDPDQLYLSGFDAPDAFTTLYANGVHLLVSSLEYGRAKKESDAETVTRTSEYDYYEKIAEYGPEGAENRILVEFLSDRGVESVAVPTRFPVGIADGLRDAGVSVTPEETAVITEIRATKTDEEIEHVRVAQKANEVSMRAAEDLLSAATVENGILHHDGEVLISERVKEEIEVTLLRHGAALDETIVACGSDAADPHNRGSGPLKANEAIIVDIFPRDKASKYHADMTRTFVKGEPSDKIRARYNLTHEAFDAALEAVEPGVTGEEVHDAVCDVYENAGYETLRSDPNTETGFIHSTGHGIGLDVHEYPKVSPAGGELKPGHVITIEPGLYDPEVGGVRIEDLVVVTEDGYENLTDYPIELVVG